VSVCTRVGFAALLLALAALPARAADEAAALRQRAEQLAAADRCDEALPRAHRARELDPKDARAALVEGRCLLRQSEYRKAIAPLTEARELDPALPGVSTDLAQCHYHLDEFDAASAELDRAEKENPDDARTQLYRGLVLSHQAKQREAAVAFERAGGLDPSLAGIAGLYAGRSYAAAQERDQARAALERARAASPDSEWGRTATQELDNLEAPNRRHVWAKARVGVEHDSNVTLVNDARLDAITISNSGVRNAHEQNDTLAVFGAETGMEFLRDESQSLGASIGYDGNAHDNVHELDLQYPWATFWYDRRLSDNTWLRLQPFGGYAWLETDPFVAHGGGTATLSHAFGNRVVGQIYDRINYNDFHYGIEPDPVIASFGTGGLAVAQQFTHFRNRDGLENEVGVEGRFAAVPGSTSLRAGSAFQRYWAEGRDWSLNASRTWLGATQALPWKFVFEVVGSYTYQRYDHRSSYVDNGPELTRYLAGGGPERRDDIWDVQGELRYPITDWLQVSARGQYTDNESNVRVFDYDRWIAGGYLTVTWGHTL
jgi:tetratricopeptide (TPR) repeat protein